LSFGGLVKAFFGGFEFFLTLGLFLKAFRFFDVFILRVRPLLP
jgi:hypothetical protein